MLDLFLEPIHKDWGQWFKVDHILYEEKTEYFDQLVFENPTLGKVHVIDGIVQSTEKDEFVYQEMLAHVPLIAHGAVKSVLIIGGGDGGVLREVLKHPSIESAHLVEIDPEIIAFTKKLLPYLPQGAFENPKSHLHIQDGSLFVKECKEKFDVILVDSSDPMGPCEVLFTKEFYADCHKLLNPNGILVNMSDVPFFHIDVLKMTHTNLKSAFSDVSYFVAAVPTYIGGFIALGFATDNPSAKETPLASLQERFKTIQGELKYYNPRIHQASFALPTFIEKAL